MQSLSIHELMKKYNLELEKIILQIKKQNAKLVLLQFPDGLKPYSTLIVDYLKEKVKGIEFLIWIGSCYGACDTPIGLEKLNPKIDLVVQFGHNEILPKY